MSGRPKTVHDLNEYFDSHQEFFSTSVEASLTSKEAALIMTIILKHAQTGMLRMDQFSIGYYLNDEYRTRDVAEGGVIKKGLALSLLKKRYPAVSDDSPLMASRARDFLEYCHIADKFAKNSGYLPIIAQSSLDLFEKLYHSYINRDKRLNYILFETGTATFPLVVNVKGCKMVLFSMFDTIARYLKTGSSNERWAGHSKTHVLIDESGLVTESCYSRLGCAGIPVQLYQDLLNKLIAKKIHVLSSVDVDSSVFKVSKKEKVVYPPEGRHSSEGVGSIWQTDDGGKLMVQRGASIESPYIGSGNSKHVRKMKNDFERRVKNAWHLSSEGDRTDYRLKAHTFDNSTIGAMIDFNERAKQLAREQELYRDIFGEKVYSTIVRTAELGLPKIISFTPDRGLNLLDVLERSPDRLTDNTLLQMALQVGALHANSVVNRDVKLENYAMDKDGRVRAFDLGGCSKVGEKIERYFGTRFYAPPELFHGEISTKTDIYALGMCFKQLVHCMPMNAELENAYIALIDCMIAPSPEKRPTIDSVIMQLFKASAHSSLLSQLWSVYKKVVGAKNFNDHFSTTKMELQNFAIDILNRLMDLVCGKFRMITCDDVFKKFNAIKRDKSIVSPHFGIEGVFWPVPMGRPFIDFIIQPETGLTFGQFLGLLKEKDAHHPQIGCKLTFEDKSSMLLAFSKLPEFRQDYFDEVKYRLGFIGFKLTDFDPESGLPNKLAPIDNPDQSVVMAGGR